MRRLHVLSLLLVVAAIVTACIGLYSKDDTFTVSERTIRQGTGEGLPGIQRIAATTHVPRPNAQGESETPGHQLAPLHVTSEPEGATVFIDGVVRGVTPFTIALSLGEYEVSVDAFQYRAYKQKVSLQGKRQTEHTFTRHAPFC